jgi:adenine-specific DNA-methyltransferase
VARRVPELRYASEHSCGPNPSGNTVIQGENLAALTALADKFEASVRCIYIDPPYNNNEVYTHYSDRWAHGRWIEELRLRLQCLKPLLTEDGSLWISIDDSEVHNLRALCESIFGRENFVQTIVWNHRTSRENRKVFSSNHEYILCVAKNAKAFKRQRNLLPASEALLSRYRNPDHDPRGPWQSVSLNVQAGHATPAQFYTLVSPSGDTFDPPKGRCWAFSKVRMEREIELGNVYFGKNNNATPRFKKFLKDAKLGVTPETLWRADDVGTTEEATKQLMSLLHSTAVFETPKPEKLLHRLLSIATDPGDIVLDAYLGSGTTAAVALKMGRTFIGIEQGDHIVTHAVGRLRRVIEGERTGISDFENWEGGGGFDFFRLAKSSDS